MAGDWTGAALELASGAASTFPGAGTAAAVGIDAALIARDIHTQKKLAATEEGITPSGEEEKTEIIELPPEVVSSRPQHTPKQSEELTVVETINPVNTLNVYMEETPEILGVA